MSNQKEKSRKRNNKIYDKYREILDLSDKEIDLIRENIKLSIYRGVFIQISSKTILVIISLDRSG